MSKEETIIDPRQAPLGREPMLLGIDWLTHERYPGQRWRSEAWQLTNGETVVIVSDNGGTSLMNASEGIAEAVDARWRQPGGVPVIIEDWTAEQPFLEGERFRVSARNGGSWEVDFNEWDDQGLVLPR